MRMILFEQRRQTYVMSMNKAMDRTHQQGTSSSKDSRFDYGHERHLKSKSVEAPPPNKKSFKCDGLNTYHAGDNVILIKDCSDPRYNWRFGEHGVVVRSSDPSKGGKVLVRRVSIHAFTSTRTHTSNTGTISKYARD